jgi:hypothetical protein
MAVYVDDAFVAGDWGVFTGGGHLQADSLAELNAFADRLGLRRAWLQTRPAKPEHDHYDLTRAGRERALALGAIDEPWRGATRRRRALRQARLAGTPAGRP